ncbi:G5 domain-containing protein [Curtobacterium sp. NPDC090223]|uniref:G5 domain-containing protein n=1 Tax=Curtobacterium sp. NPDC090223 TaxID=3363972 RepID=UPI0037FE1054
MDEESPIPFDTATVEDPSLAKGQTKLRTAGVNGVLTTTYRITETDGVEIHREKTNETVTTPPVTEVTAVGTYVAPAAADPSPADPPPVAPEQQNQGTITPGAFCADAQSGAVAQAANGRSYQCGGKGPDANGHLHWNTM